MEYLRELRRVQESKRERSREFGSVWERFGAFLKVLESVEEFGSVRVRLGEFKSALESLGYFWRISENFGEVWSIWDCL